jgi:uncharacterized DUF497 family protein
MYEWDEDKEALNRAKHHVGFTSVWQFEWNAAVYEKDDRYDYGEERFRAFGHIGERPHCLVFTPRGQNIRVISLRPMHEKEARRYGISKR